MPVRSHSRTLHAAPISSSTLCMRPKGHACVQSTLCSSYVLAAHYPVFRSLPFLSSHLPMPAWHFQNTHNHGRRHNNNEKRSGCFTRVLAFTRNTVLADRPACTAKTPAHTNFEYPLPSYHQAAAHPTCHVPRLLT